MQNGSKGTIYYGMHFYPGVAEYQNDPNSEPYRVFLNEDTIRAMDPTFAGRPVFVMHVDGVSDDVNKLREEADGWVIESFYNQADGKHWVKFIVVSDRGERAIRNGMRLSNCYVPKGPFGQGGLWNGVTYAKEIKGGEYEHLALVPNPRYEESVVLTPEQFKKYNEDKLGELKRLANAKKESKSMLKFFKKEKVENAADLEGMSILLEKSQREVTIAQLVNEADAAEMAKKAPRIANGSDKVTVGDDTMTVAQLIAKHEEVCEALENAKKKHNDEEDEDEKKKEKKENDDDDMMNDDDEWEDKKKKKENDDDEMDEEVKKKKNKKKKNESDESPEAIAARKKAKEKADRVRNAPDNVQDEPVKLDLDQVARGKARYGS